MINRILIRIKVVQMVYSYLLKAEGQKLSDAKKELEQSLDKAYELYHLLLLLPGALTRLQEKRLENAKNKYLPTEEELNPNMKFIENQFVQKMDSCATMDKYLEDHPMSWDADEVYLRLALDKVLKSDIYQDYMANTPSTLENDCELWRELMRKVILPDDDLAEVLETRSVYWNDDLGTIGTFVLKTIKRFATEGNEDLLPEYKDEEDHQFADVLFSGAIANKDAYMELIDKFVAKDSWDTDRLAFMDVVVLLVAITELEKVPSVPTKVTMNEYIEIAKSYSTGKSGQFVNGILNSIINYLKEEGKLFKE